MESKACVAFTLRRRTALALGDPIGPPDLLDFATRDFIAYCDKQDWIPAFYQVDEPRPYRRLDLTLVSIGAEAILDTAGFSLAGGKRANVRHTVRRCEREGVRFSFTSGPEALAVYGGQLQDVSGHWLRSHHSPELRYSLGTLATLTDPDIVVGMAFRSDGRLEAFVSWLPVPARKAWTLDLMRRRPDSVYGAIDALIAKSVAEADERGVAQLSLGVAPRVIASPGVPPALDRAIRAVYWGLDRFQRSSTLREFKEKFGPRWEDRYLVVPGSSTLPEVMVALALAHLPPIPAIATWIRSWLSPERRPGGRRALA